LANFKGGRSWLFFHLLNLTGKQEDWLNVPPEFFIRFNGYKKARDFVRNLTVVNCPAERGVNLIFYFKDHCRHDENREYLQVIEAHRRQFPGTSHTTE
jgi:hypothetical protein